MSAKQDERQTAGDSESGSRRWWDGEAEVQKRKWQYLEHKGVLFPDNYRPRGLAVLFRGSKLPLDAFQEELAWYWTQSLESDYMSRQHYRKNFEKEFLKAFDEKALGENPQLADFDFSAVRSVQLREKELKEQQTKEDKQRAKEEREAMEAPYRYALIDGEFERISNVRIEPPTLFKGRGEHPKAGFLKQRVAPEDVEINLAKEAPVPKLAVRGRCWGGIATDNETSWLLSYNESLTHNKKYVFLAAGSKLKGQNDMKKYEKARKLVGVVDKIRQDYSQRMESKSLRERQLGTAAYLIDFLAIRVGNEKKEEEADTVGCCSLRKEHVSLEPDNVLTLDFLGKDSIQYKNRVEINPVAWRNLSEFVANKKPEDDIFNEISTAKLNDYLSSLMEGLTAKVFRTFNASTTLQRELSAGKVGDSVEEKLEFYNEANRRVALLCNHQKTATKKTEASLEKLDEKIEELRASLKKIKKTDRLFAKTRDSLSRLEKNRETRLRNKQVALNTSKINYNDPRISVAWCKRTETPIEKVFTSVMLDKFVWAMETKSDWDFDPSKQPAE